MQAINHNYPAQETLKCEWNEVLKRGLNRFLNQEEKKRGRRGAVPIIIVRLPGQRAG
jgi:hypothetical protein